MEESRKESGMRTFSWLNGGLITLLVGVYVVRNLTTILSTSDTVSTVIDVLYLAAVANVVLFLKALLQRQFLLAVLCLLVAGGFSILLVGIIFGLGAGKLSK
jgi:hypothetical protein